MNSIRKVVKARYTVAYSSHVDVHFAGNERNTGMKIMSPTCQAELPMNIGPESTRNPPSFDFMFMKFLRHAR